MFEFTYVICGFLFCSNVPLLGYAVEVDISQYNIPVICEWKEVDLIERIKMPECTMLSEWGGLSVFAFPGGKIIRSQEVLIIIDSLQNTIRIHSKIIDFHVAMLVFRNVGISAWLYMKDILPFHASSFCIQNSVYAVSGESGTGKSSFSFTALRQSDTCFYCDDIFAVKIENEQVISLPSPSVNPKIDINYVMTLGLPKNIYQGLAYAYDGQEFYVDLKDNKRSNLLTNNIIFLYLKRDSQNRRCMIRSVSRGEDLQLLVCALKSSWLLSPIEKAKILYKLRLIKVNANAYVVNLPDGITQLASSVQNVMQELTKYQRGCADINQHPVNIII